MLRRTAIAALVAALLAPAVGVAGSLSIGSGPTTTGSAMPLFQAPLTRPGLIPSDLTCTDGTNARGWRCMVPAGEDRWACWGPDGSEVPVTQGTGTTYEETPFGRAAFATDNAAPRLIASAGAGIRAVFSGNHTVVQVYRGGTTVSAARALAWGSASSGGFHMVDNPSSTACVWYNPEATPASISPLVSVGVQGKWAVHSARRSGDSYSCRVNGQTASQSWAASAKEVSVATYFGRYGNDGLGLDGHIAHTLIFPCALNDDSLSRLESQIFGTRASDGRPITTTRAGPAWCDGGYQVGDNAPCVSAAGLESYGAVLSWAQNGARPDLWATFIGTPTITGPDADGWYTYTDDDVAAREVKRLGIIGAGSVTDGSYVVSCEMRPGTLTQARTLISKTAGPGTITTGAGGDCSTWNITLDTARRYSCPINITGTDATTELTFVFEVGFDGLVATVGDIGIRQCQIEKSTAPGRRCDSGSSPTTCPGDVHTVSTAGWPVESGWCEFDYTPATAGTEQKFLLDSRANANGLYFYSAGGTGTLALCMRSPDAPTCSQKPTTWMAGETYRIRATWGPNGLSGTRRSMASGETIVVPLNNVVGAYPRSHAANAYIGAAITANTQANGTIANLRCGGL